MNDLLDLAREARAENGVVDLRSLKAAAVGLPDFIVADREGYDTLTLIDAIVFHLKFAISLKAFESPPQPAPPKKPTSGVALLKELGLI